MIRNKYLEISLIAVIGSCLVVLAIYKITMGSLPWELKRSCVGIEATCEMHIRNAEKRAGEVVSTRAGEFVGFMESKKVGIKPFSTDMISPVGMWRVLKPKLPGTDTDGHKKYVIEKFNEHLFTPEDFGNALRRSIERGIRDIEGIENDLAVALHQEILGRSVGADEKTRAEAEFRDAIENLLPAAQNSGETAAGHLAGSEAISYVATQVFIRLGVQAGLISAGAAAAPWTLGATLVIGTAISAVWDWIAKPADRIEAEMTVEIEKLARNGSIAIRTELTKIVKVRSTLWRTAAYGALR